MRHSTPNNIHIRSVASESAIIATGLRGVSVFKNTPSKCISCSAIELGPQSSSEPEHNTSSGIIVHVLSCEDDLASFTMNGAKMELRNADHLSIPDGCTFYFTNSSLSVPLKLRILKKTTLVPAPSN